MDEQWLRSQWTTWINRIKTIDLRSVILSACFNIACHNVTIRQLYPFITVNKDFIHYDYDKRQKKRKSNNKLN